MGRNGYRYWSIQLSDERKGLKINDNSGVANVLVDGSPTEVTLYADEVATAKSNPLTFTDGFVDFWTAESVSSVDISILTAAGEAIFISGQSASEVRINVDTQKREQTLMIPFAASTAETDTGFDLPANLLLESCCVRVTTVDATETLDVGLLSSEAGGDANGLISAISVATAGVIQPIVYTNGSNEAYVSAFVGGALMYAGRVGTDLDQDNGMAGSLGYVTDGTAKSITHTGTAGSDTAAGYIILKYVKLT